uniref:TLC domain-containing protein n=1 Tax=Panagrolaimus sp. JU765 TaxID=591449 RepID=A0AC34QNS0_9BILA
MGNFWDEIEWNKVGEVAAYVLVSFVCFRILQFAARWYLFGKCTFRTFSYFQFAQRHRRHPDSQSIQVHPPNKKWRISNEAVSLLHSVISGLWALYTILNYHIIDDMVKFRDQFALYLIYMSFGYIVHDLIDLLINERSMRIIELLFHHVVVITAFLTTLITQKFLAVVVFGLLMELNSIFLHSRSLLNLYRLPKKSVAFKMIALLNLVTFIIFRMAVSGYLLKWQFTEAWKMEWYYTLITFLVIASLATVNTILLYRVLSADGLLGKKRARSETIVPKPDEEVAVEDDEEEDFGEVEDYDEDDVESGNSNARVLPPTSPHHAHAPSNVTASTAVIDDTSASNPAVNSSTPMV